MVVNFTVKWKKEVFPFDIEDPTTFRIEELKGELFYMTEVLPERQKLLLKGKTLKDEDWLDVYLPADDVGGNGKAKQIMMLGSPEADLQFLLEPPEFDIIDDFEEDESEELDAYMRADDQKKIQRRVALADKNIEIKNPPRAGKKLLMLDIDYTFFDHKSTAETGAELTRPFLHEFLTAVYPHYDIGIWSATSRKWIDLKLLETGIMDHPNFKIHVIMDYRSMVSTYVKRADRVANIKPLDVLWQYSNQMYNADNTIMFDDLQRNFLMNPQNGLRIKAFRNGPTIGRDDTELVELAEYLLMIKDLPSLKPLNHKKWRSYCEKQKKRNGGNNGN